MENSKELDPVSLIDSVEKQVKKVHTTSLDISLNEILDMYKNNELDIYPEYQRLFQWSVGARSRFIESLLLEMPVPPIFVLEEDEGKYTLIDGLQRISSYLHLRGELVADHLEPSVKKGEKLVLMDCDIIPELNGKTFDQLGTSLQIRLKRAFVRVEVIRKGSDPLLKYHMFKRLNNGGQLLTEQQIRNCTIRLLDSTFNDFIIKLSKNDAFIDCIGTIADSRIWQAQDQELVLRFFALKNFRDKYKGYLGDFLTEYMEWVAKADAARKPVFYYAEEERVFTKTFELLSKALGERSFGFYDRNAQRMTKGFSANNYEAITIGLQPVLESLSIDDSVICRKFEEKVLQMKSNPEYIALTAGGGKNSIGQLNKRIQFVTEQLLELQ